jgi:hypothetical protein
MYDAMYPEKNLLRYHSVHHKHHMDILGSNPGLRSEEAATNLLRGLV